MDTTTFYLGTDYNNDRFVYTTNPYRCFVKWVPQGGKYWKFDTFIKEFNLTLDAFESADLIKQTWEDEPFPFSWDGKLLMVIRG